MSSIRLKYSGLVNFASRIISVATGLIFTIIVTRRLSEESFGAWQFYSSLLGYFTIPSGIVNYWLTRDLARGNPVAKSGVFFNSLVSLVSATLFIILSPFFTASVSIDFLTVFAFILWIVVIHHTLSLEAVCSGVEPHIIGYASIIFEVTKVVIGAILVGYLRLMLFGAVLSVDIALIIQALYYSLKLSKYFNKAFSLGHVKRWFRNGWIPLISNAPAIMNAQDVLILTLLTGSLLPAAYLGVANRFAGAIVFAGALAVGLYPKLLSGGTGRDVEESLELVLLFLMPMVLGQIILAEPILYLFREEYALVQWVLRTMAVCFAIIVMKNFFSAIILGVEKTDISVNATWRNLAKSYLMKIPLFDFAGSAVYVISVSLATIVLKDMNATPTLIAFSAAICSLLINMLLLLYYLKTSRKLIRFNLNMWRPLKFLASALAMSMVLLLLYPESAKSEQILIVLTALMPVMLVGIIVYFGTLYLIDSKFRTLLKSVFKWRQTETSGSS
ncbi:MAG: hypothetical protein QXF52_09565 [Thermoproteota archaeon]